MSGLLKAKLTPLDGDTTPVAVQFNPTSLRIVRENQIEREPPPTGPAVQHVGASSTLSLDLHFDSADEGTTDAPINVQTKTAKIAQFVIPRSNGNSDKQAPPRVQFAWGQLVIEGVMTSFSEDLELFSPGGVPLRAKVSISIQGQDPSYEALAAGPGSAKGAGASAPGGGALAFGAGAGLGLSAGFGAAIGGGTIGLPQLSIGGGIGGGLSLGAGGISGGFAAPRIGVALGGESPAAFAARVGLDPAAWRTLAAPGGVGLSLRAGTEIAFPKGAGTAPGVGTARGSTQHDGPGALERVAGPAAPATTPQAAATTGFALAAAGGIDAAVQTVRQARADAASATERRAFGVDFGRAEPADAQPAAAAHAPRSPLRDGELPRPRALAPPAPPPPRADERATSFGLGVPLRPRRGDPVAGRPVLGHRAPAWTQAPAPPTHGGPRDDCGCGCGDGP